MNDNLSPIRYHQICQNHTQLLCFRDQHNLCICVDHRLRAECFRYDDQLDHCTRCLSDGRCLASDIRSAKRFLCLCPPCYSGRQCEFSSKSFTFTLDQLFYADLLSAHRHRTIIILLFFFYSWSSVGHSQQSLLIRDSTTSCLSSYWHWALLTLPQYNQSDQSGTVSCPNDSSDFYRPRMHSLLQLGMTLCANH